MISLCDLTTEQVLWLRRHRHINGCGPTSWKHAIPTPHCTSLCDEHDLRYWWGGTDADRKAADYALYDGIRREARKLSLLAWLLALLEAWSFYRAVRARGGDFWHRGKQRTLADIGDANAGALRA